MRSPRSLLVALVLLLLALLPAPSAAQDLPDGLSPAPQGCVGDGTSGPRVEVLLAPVDGGRGQEMAARAPGWVETIDRAVLTSAERFGAAMRVRWLQDDACEPVISEVDVPADQASDTDGIRAALRDAGIPQPGRRHLVYVDAPPPPDACGLGDVHGDDRPGLDNGFATSPDVPVAVVWPACWADDDVLAASAGLHELLHVWGAVLQGSPNHVPGDHCSDEWDVMCDAAEVPTHCTREVDKLLMDCGGDDYFNPTPAAGSWLDEHWNTWWSPWLTPLAGPERRIVRVAGQTRFETAVAVADRGGPGPRSVVVGTAGTFADSVAAGPAARQDGDALLLVTPDAVPQVTADRIRALQPEFLTILGGEAAISEAVAEELRSLVAPGTQVVRLAGATRIETAADLAEYTVEAAEVVYLADGGSYTSALVAASAATRRAGEAPLLLTAGGTIPPATRAQIQRLGPAEIVVVGTAAQADGVVAEAQALAPSVSAIVAEDPIELSLAALQAEPGGHPQIGLASVEDFPDALVATSLRSAVVLVPSSGPPPAALRDALLPFGTREILVFGGTAAIADSVPAGL